MTCLDPDLLASLESGLLDDTKRTETLGHLDGCPPCRAFKAELARALEKLAALPKDTVLPEPAPATWERIRARLAKPVVALAPEVAVGCAYCKDRLVRAEAVYCAGCLAPHHDACWSEHGRCAACGADVIVRAEKGARRPRGGMSLAIAALAAGIGVGAAALAPWRAAQPGTAPSTLTSAARSAVSGPNSTELDAAGLQGGGIGRAIADVQPGDSVTVTLPSGEASTGRIGVVTPSSFTLNVWNDGWLLSDVAVARREATVQWAPLVSESEVTLDGRKVQLRVERFQHGSDAQTRVTVQHADQASILRHLVVVFDSKARCHEEHLSLLVAGAEAKVTYPGDPWSCKVTIENADFVLLLSPDARPALVAALERTQSTAVADAIVRHGDPELVLALATTDLHYGPAGYRRAFTSLDARCAKALLDDVLVPDERYRIRRPRSDGTLELDSSVSPSLAKVRELSHVAQARATLSEECLRTLARIFETGSAAVTDAAVDVANAHAPETLQALIASDAVDLETAARLFARMDAPALSLLAGDCDRVGIDLPATAIRAGDATAIRKAIAKLREHLSATGGKR